MTTGKAYAAEIRRQRRESYARYERGLQLLDQTPDLPTLEPATRDDWQAALDALNSLNASVRGAGRNTWAKHEARYQAARERFVGFPVPCEATLHKVEGPCESLGFDNRPVCKVCYIRILAAASRTGMLIDESEEK